MKIIVGLGNPGREYVNTRHNVGFRVVDELANTPEFTENSDGALKFHINDDFSDALIAETIIKGEKVLLVKPQGFMNVSGEAVGKIARFYKVESPDIWVISDDLDIPLGKIRVRKDGTSGGHNGIKSIISHLNTEDFPRVKVGIAQINKCSLSAKEYVLTPFMKDEVLLAKLAIEKSAKIILEALLKREGLTTHTEGII